MSSRLTRPVGRLWDVAGDRLGAPGAAEAFAAEALALLDAYVDERFRLLLVDRGRGLVRTLTITDDPAEWVSPTTVLNTIGAALRDVSWSTLNGPMPYEVLCHLRPRDAGERPLGTVELAPMRGRLHLLEGGGAADPEVTAAIEPHLRDLADELPGCVALALMVDPGRDALLVLTVWADLASARGAAAREDELLAARQAAGSNLDSGTYEVLAFGGTTPGARR